MNVAVKYYYTKFEIILDKVIPQCYTLMLDKVVKEYYTVISNDEDDSYIK